MLKVLMSLVLSLLSTVSFWADQAQAQSGQKTFLVLGVIASAEVGKGVALLKAMPNGETFAARTGQQVDTGVYLEQITRDYVYMKVGSRREKVRVGDQWDGSPRGDGPTTFGDISSGVERKGEVVRMTSALRDSLTKEQLSKVLMQAAAVPYYEDGQLLGFRLLEIEAGSIYQRVGFVDGDLITAINGQTLSDVAMTIKLLQQLKNEARAEVAYTRQGSEQKLQLIVQ